MQRIACPFGRTGDAPPQSEAVWRGYYACAERILTLYAGQKGREKICRQLQDEGCAFRDRCGQPVPLEVDDVRRVTPNWQEYGGYISHGKARDRIVCKIAEAQALFPGIEGVVVKEGIERFTARLLHPSVGQARIREGAQRAVRNAAQLQPFKVQSPSSMGFEFTSTAMAEVCSWLPTVKRVNGRTVEFSFHDWREGMGLLSALMYIALHVADSVY